MEYEYVFSPMSRRMAESYHNPHVMKMWENSQYGKRQRVTYWPEHSDHVHIETEGTTMGYPNKTTTFVGIVTTSDGRYRGNWQVVSATQSTALEAIMNAFKAITEGDIIRLNSCSDGGLKHIENYVAAKPALQAVKRPNDNMPEWDINGNCW